MSLEKLTGIVIEYLRAPRSIEHVLKVYAYARGIGGEEGLGTDDMLTLGAAGLLHDIGIPSALDKFGTAHGRCQEEEGARISPKLLERCGSGIRPGLHGRIVWLVGHHHTEELATKDPLLQMLMEADYLVNLVEGNLPDVDPRDVMESFFRTRTGKRYLAAVCGL